MTKLIAATCLLWSVALGVSAHDYGWKDRDLLAAMVMPGITTQLSHTPERQFGVFYAREQLTAGSWFASKVSGTPCDATTGACYVPLAPFIVIGDDIVANTTEEVNDCDNAFAGLTVCEAPFTLGDVDGNGSTWRLTAVNHQRLGDCNLQIYAGLTTASASLVSTAPTTPGTGTPLGTSNTVRTGEVSVGAGQTFVVSVYYPGKADLGVGRTDNCGYDGSASEGGFVLRVELETP